MLRVKIRFDGWVFESSNAIRLLPRVIEELIDRSPIANDPRVFAFRQNYKDKDGGKIVLYTTSMGIVRSTYTKCQTVKKILNTLMVKYEERDVFMSTVSDDSISQRAWITLICQLQVHQQEIRERMESDEIDVPQLFVDGQYIGVSAALMNCQLAQRVPLFEKKKKTALATIGAWRDQQLCEVT